MDKQKLFDIVDSYRDDIIATLRKWLSVPSVNAEPDGENAPFAGYGHGGRRGDGL